jgi:hypothetical protein
MLAAALAVAAGFAAISPGASAQEHGQKTFASAGDACQALVAALTADDEESLKGILGPGSGDLISSGDPVEDKQRRQQFLEKYQQMHRLKTEPDGMTTLYVGAENWPAPVPLAHKGTSWYFDTAAGKQEILYRRIGQNELSVIQVCRELVNAEKEYRAEPHDGDSTLQYAQHLYSSMGRHDGLYWQMASGERESPIGPLVAAASAEGYAEGAGRQSEPFYGYYFRILTGEKRAGTADVQSYIVDGKMTRGFAVIAYPAEYRSSGVMTFIVAQDGVVYQKDLGQRTAEIAKSIAQYERDASWAKAD